MLVFTVSSLFLPPHICVVTHSHAVFASNLARSLWPWFLTIPTMQCPTKAHCPRRWAEPAELWRPHLCVYVYAHVCMECVTKNENIRRCLLPRYCSYQELFHGSHTHKDQRAAHADSHAWNIVCIKYLMRCVMPSAVVLRLSETSCLIRWPLLSCVMSPETQRGDLALRNKFSTTYLYAILFMRTLQPITAHSAETGTKCFILFSSNTEDTKGYFAGRMKCNLRLVSFWSFEFLFSALRDCTVETDSWKTAVMGFTGTFCLRMYSNHQTLRTIKSLWLF